MENLCSLSGEELYSKALEFESVGDHNNSIIYMVMAANKGYIDAIDNMWNGDSWEKQDYFVTGDFYIETASDDNIYSNHFLGFMYDEGLGNIKKDCNKALELYQLGMEKGCVASINNLGHMYENGISVIRDYKKALELYQLGIDKGCAVSINNMALMYEYGFGVIVDYKKAANLYALSAEKNYPIAMNNLATLYQRGTGVQKNSDMAIFLFKQAISCGCIISYTGLANTYRRLSHNHRGQYYNEICNLYQKAIEMGCNETLDILVSFYRTTCYNHKKSEIINFFIKINRTDKIYEIFGSEDTFII